MGRMEMIGMYKLNGMKVMGWLGMGGGWSVGWEARFFCGQRGRCGLSGRGDGSRLQGWLDSQAKRGVFN